MFRLLNVHALLARDYQLADAGPGWRIARVDMMGGRESDSSAWTIALAKGRQRRLLSWSDFLASASISSDPPQLVGDFLDGLLGQVEARLRNRARRREMARALRAGTTAGETLPILMRGDGPLADWLQTGRQLDPASAGVVELLEALGADLESDRRLLQRGRTAPAALRPPVHLSIQLPADAAPVRFPRNGLAARLDQACAACRGLLTLAGSQPSTERAESVAQAVITGAAESWLDERLRSLFPDQSCAATVRTEAAKEAEAGEPEEQHFHADLAFEVPLWSLRQRSPLTLRVRLAVAGSARVQTKLLEQMLQDTLALLRDWSAHRTAPLVSGGDGWLGLLDHMTWDQEMYVRWLAAAPLHERVARLTAIGKQPESRDKQNGWQSLLAGVASDADQLRSAEWLSAGQHLALWSAEQQAELTAALRRSALARMRAPDATTAEIAEWLAAWRQVGSPGPAQSLFAGLNARATHSLAEEDAHLAQAFWRDAERPAAWIPTLATLWLALPGCATSVVTELAAALAPDDPRRQASAAVSACVEAVSPDQPPLALPPLAQAEARPEAWRIEEAWRARVAESFATWTARLDRSQQHETWRALLAHRATLIACRILTD